MSPVGAKQHATFPSCRTRSYRPYRPYRARRIPVALVATGRCPWAGMLDASGVLRTGSCKRDSTHTNPTRERGIRKKTNEEPSLARRVSVAHSVPGSSSPSPPEREPIRWLLAFWRIWSSPCLTSLARPTITGQACFRLAPAVGLGMRERSVKAITGKCANAPLLRSFFSAQASSSRPNRLRPSRSPGPRSAILAMPTTRRMEIPSPLESKILARCLTPIIPIPAFNCVIPRKGRDRRCG